MSAILLEHLILWHTVLFLHNGYSYTMVYKDSVILV